MSTTKEKLTTRRPKEPILIIEDKHENQVLLQGICDQIGVVSVVVGNGKEAVELLSHKKFSLYLVDLMMPVMDGKTFIQELSKIEPDATILVQTAVDDPEAIIEVMKLGVYDYLMKPLYVELVADRINKALEYVYLKRMEKVLVEEETNELRNQLEWLNYKEASRNSKESKSQIQSILNLKTTINQGSGIGSLVTLLDTISQTKLVSNDSVSFDRELWELVEENHRHNRVMISGLNASCNLIESKIHLETRNSTDILSLLPSITEEFRERWEQKGIHIHLPMVKTSVSLLIDLPLLRTAIHEIFTNGLKYGPKGSRFDIFVTFVQGYFCISFKNNLANDQYSRELDGREKDLLHPFFRIHPPVEDFYEKEIFSLGLGLSMVDLILQRHNGIFFLRKAKDHTTSEITDCMIAEIFIPILNAKEGQNES